MSKKSTAISRESRNFQLFLNAFFLCALSGYAILLTDSYIDSAQINIITHVLLGFLFSVFFIIYSLAHFKRTLGIKKPAVILGGVIAAAAISGYLYTGFYLAIIGHQETSPEINHWHKIGSVIIIVLTLVHVVSHRHLKYQTRTGNNTPKTYKKSSLIKAIKCSAIYIFTVLTLSMAYAWYDQPLTEKALTKNYTYPYGKNPFRPSQVETSNGSFIHEKQIAGSEQCASCHTDIARQWYSSAHRQAASDPVYSHNISLLAEERGIEATRYCEGCHTPVALLTGELTPGGAHGGVPGTTAHAEGITCLSCHAIENTVHLDGVASYLYKVPQEYLFSKSDSPLLNSVGRYLIRISADKHKQDMAPAVLHEARHCATCHTQFMDKDINNWGWVKMQDEYSAWLNSPFSKQHQQTFSAENMTRCQDCHMPLVKANDPSANSDGMVRSHRFLAANTMLPTLSGDAEQLKLIKSFLQASKLRITIQTPNRKEALQTDINLDEKLKQHREKPYYQYLGETVDLNVLVNNTGVGHDFPGGTIDLNEAWIELLVRDSTGRAVYSSGTLNEEGYLDPDAHTYHSIPVDRHGKQVWTHELFNMIGETYRNVIRAGGSDIAEYQFTIPYWVRGPLVVDATVKYRKLNKRYAIWALKDQYRDLPVIDMARDTLVVDVLHEKEVMN